MTPVRAELLGPRHDVSRFDCGDAALNGFLSKYGLANQRNDTARTYVAVREGEIIGFYSLAAGSVPYERAPERVRKGIARHDVPIVLMARLAVSLDHQGRGIGRDLFVDALGVARDVADRIGARALFVRAKDERAAEFYRRFLLVPAVDEPLELFLLMKDIRLIASL